MTDLLSFARAIDGVPMVADAATREARFPVATRVQDQRVYRLDTSTTERWSGSAWLTETPHIPVNAAPNGATDATAAFNAAITAAASSGQVVKPRPGTYVVQGIAMQSNVTLDLSGVTLVKNGGAAGTVVIGMTGSTTATSVSAAANIALGDTVLTGTSPTGFAVGDWVLVYDATYKYGTSGRNQEINRVAGVTTNLTLANRTIGSYATASGATIVKLSPIVNAHVVGDGTLQIPSGTAGGGITGTLTVDCSVRGPLIIGPNDSAGVRFDQSLRPLVRRVRVRDGQNLTSGGFGYGIQIGESTVGFLVSKCDTSGIRENPITNNARHGTVELCTDMGAYDNSFNTHGAGCEHVTFRRCVSLSPKALGFTCGFSTHNAGDTNITFDHCEVYRAGAGAFNCAAPVGLENRNIRFLGCKVDGFGVVTASSQGIGIANTIGVQVDAGCDVSGANLTNANQCVLLSSVQDGRVANTKCRDTSNGYGIQHTNCTDVVIEENKMLNISSSNIRGTGTATRVTVRNNTSDDTDSAFLGTERRENNVWGTKFDKDRGATSVADGGTIAHACVAAPTSVRLTGTVAGQIVTVISVSSTTITVAIKTGAGAAGTTQTVYWEAEV